MPDGEGITERVMSDGEGSLIESCMMIRGSYCKLKEKKKKIQIFLCFKHGNISINSVSEVLIVFLSIKYDLMLKL